MRLLSADWRKTILLSNNTRNLHREPFDLWMYSGKGWLQGLVWELEAPYDGLLALATLVEGEYFKLNTAPYLFTIRERELGACSLVPCQICPLFPCSRIFFLICSLYHIFTCSYLQNVFKGLEKQSEIGLLSLFEHYKSCEVSFTWLLMFMWFVAYFCQGETRSRSSGFLITKIS